MKNKIIQKTYTHMHNGKRKNNNNYYYTTTTTKLLQEKQTTRVKAPITTKKNNKKPVALRSVNRSKRRRHVVLPSNTVLRLFCLVSNIILQPEIVANDRTTYVELCV